MIYAIVLKDWERMQDLLDRGKDGQDVAAKIKNVAKAVARYVAGVKLLDREAVVTNHRGERMLPYSDFREFGLKAIQLGATLEDIAETYNAAQVPADFKDTHVTKDSYTGYTGNLRRLIDQLCAKYGLEATMNFTNDGIAHWSWETRDAECRDGRVWPLSYKVTFKTDFKEWSCYVVVVTNEGGGNFGYDYNGGRHHWSDIKNTIAAEVVANLVEA